MAKAKGRLRGKQPKLSKIQSKHLLELYASGTYTTAELAELFSVSRATVYRLDPSGLPPPRDPHRPFAHVAQSPSESKRVVPFPLCSLRLRARQVRYLPRPAIRHVTVEVTPPTDRRTTMTGALDQSSLVVVGTVVPTTGS